MANTTARVPTHDTTQSQKATLRVVVIGCGLGGGVLALLLKKVANIQVTVVELRTPQQISETGSGFNIAPNGMQVLSLVGLSEGVIAVGCIAGDFAFRNKSGRELARFPVTDGTQVGAHPSVSLGRADLARLLLDKLASDGVDCRFGQRVERVVDESNAASSSSSTSPSSSSSCAQVHLADGTILEADVVVGADGVHSRVRASIFPSHAKAEDYMVGLGALVSLQSAKHGVDGMANGPASSLAGVWTAAAAATGGNNAAEGAAATSTSDASVPDLAFTTGPDARTMSFCIGNRGQIGYSSGIHDNSMWMWWCHEDKDDFDALVAKANAAAAAAAGNGGNGGNGGDAATTAANNTDANTAAAQIALRDHVMKRYGSWHPTIAALVRASPFVISPRIFLVRGLPAWHSGRCILIGDAAHAMSPTSGQGVSMALEDALILAKMLRAHVAKANADPASAAAAVVDRKALSSLFASFEKTRRKRCEEIMQQALDNDARQKKEVGAVGQWFRDKVVFPMITGFIIKGLRGVHAYDISWEE